MTNLTESQQTVTVATVLQGVKELEPMFQSNGKITFCPGEGGGQWWFLKIRKEEMCTLASPSSHAGWLHETVQSTYMYRYTDHLYLARVRKSQQKVDFKGGHAKTMQSHNYQVLSHFSQIFSVIFSPNLLLTSLTLQSVSLCVPALSHPPPQWQTHRQKARRRGLRHLANKTHFGFLSIFNEWHWL